MKFKFDLSQHFGFLLSDVAKRYGDRFDRFARERIGLSRAQCRVLGVLALNGDEPPLSQAELAQRLDLSAMAVATLCDRMEAAGWLRRVARRTDRRVNEVHLLQPRASASLEAALALSMDLQAQSFEVLAPQEQAQLLHLLGKVRDGLLQSADVPLAA